MKPPRLAVYGLVLAGMLGGGAVVGAAVGPAETKPAAMAHKPADGAEAGVGANGLAIAEAGYAIDADQTVLAPGASEFRFRILGPDGAPVRRFTTQHDKDLHLKPAGGPSLTLGVDVVVPGDYQPPPTSTAAHRATVDGFEVEMAGEPTAGREGTVTMPVTKDGRPVALQPYLGANGHLVAIRSGDLAYLHVHPMAEQAKAGSVPFGVEVPSAGRYRMFFDFQVDGVVRTAAFTVDVPQSKAAPR